MIKVINLGLTKYSIAMIEMDMAFENVKNGAEECIIITEHEELYSAGKSFEAKDFISTPKYPVYFPQRGGRVTVHAPGQLVVYPIINLKKRNINVSSYVKILEYWIIAALKKINIDASLSNEGVGVWVKDAKIGFVGIRIKNGISSHGFCVNVNNDLSMFNSIVPCGIKGIKITSLEKILNTTFPMSEICEVFINTLPF